MRNLIIILISLISLIGFGQNRLQNRKVYDNFDYISITYDDIKFNSKEELRDAILYEFAYLLLLQDSKSLPETIYKVSEETGHNVLRLRKLEVDEYSDNKIYYYYTFDPIFEQYLSKVSIQSFTICVDYSSDVNRCQVTIRLGEDFDPIYVKPYPEVVFSGDQTRMDLYRNIFYYIKSRFKVVGVQPPYKMKK